MAPPLGFDALKSILHRQIAALPDHRQAGPNTRYRIQDAAGGAFGIFVTQSPSVLESQRHLQQTQGHNHASTRFGVEPIPCHHPRRTRLAPLRPRALDRVDLAVFAGLEPQGWLANVRGLTKHLWLAREGTPYFSSRTLHGSHGRKRQTAQGPTLSSQSALTPVMGCPGRSEVIAWPPECLRPQEGHAKQACARVAGQRWMAKHARQIAPYRGTVLGDALSRNHPRGQCALENGCNCLCGCTPEAHATLYERLAFGPAHAALTTLESRRWPGRCTEVPR
jgi:hypothetical protein